MKRSSFRYLSKKLSIVIDKCSNNKSQCPSILTTFSMKNSTGCSSLLCVFAFFRTRKAGENLSLLELFAIFDQKSIKMISIMREKCLTNKLIENSLNFNCA